MQVKYDRKLLIAIGRSRKASQWQNKEMMGIPSVGGPVWHHTMIAYVITNEHYCGNLLLQKTFVTDHLTKRKRINRGELERIHVKGTHEAIIDPDTFRKVQEIYRMRREHYCSKTHAVEPYLFTGVLKCANCGASYRRKVNHRGTSYEKVIWVCATYTMRGKAACPSKAVPDEVLMRKTAEVFEADCVEREMLLDAVERIEGAVSLRGSAFHYAKKRHSGCTNLNAGGKM